MNPPDKPIDCKVLKKFTTCDRSFYPGDHVGPEACRAENRGNDPHAPLMGGRQSRQEPGRVPGGIGQAGGRFISREVGARKLANRKLGKQRKNLKITAGEVHTGKQEWRQLRDIGVELAGDRASGELRYSTLQNCGYRLDGLMAGWREKLAIDPAILRHYEEQADQATADRQAQRAEERRHAIPDFKEEIDEADLGESAISELLTEPAVASEPACEPASIPAPAEPAEVASQFYGTQEEEWQPALDLVVDTVASDNDVADNPYIAGGPAPDAQTAAQVPVTAMEPATAPEPAPAPSCQRA